MKRAIQGRTLCTPQYVLVVVTMHDATKSYLYCRLRQTSAIGRDQAKLASWTQGEHDKGSEEQPWQPSRGNSGRRLGMADWGNQAKMWPRLPPKRTKKTPLLARIAPGMRVN